VLQSNNLLNLIFLSGDFFCEKGRYRLVCKYKLRVSSNRSEGTTKRIGFVFECLGPVAGKDPIETPAKAYS
jgi:hypothetical protein